MTETSREQNPPTFHKKIRYYKPKSKYIIQEQLNKQFIANYSQNLHIC